MKPRFRVPSSLFHNPHRPVLHLASVLVMSALPVMAQSTFEWTGGVEGTGTNLFGSGGYANWDPNIAATDIATGTNNNFSVATRTDGGPGALIGGGTNLSMSASPTMGRFIFDNASDHFPNPLVIQANGSGTTARVIRFETPDTTIIELNNSVTGVVKLGIGASGTPENAVGNFSLRLPASGVSTFHVANPAATLDLSGLADAVLSRGAIHGGDVTQTETEHARIRKTGAGTLDLRTTDGQGNRVLGTIIEGGTAIVGSAPHFGWLPLSPMSDHVVLNGGTLQLNNLSAFTATNRGFQVGSLGGAVEVVGASTGISGIVSDIPDQAGVLIKKGTFILTLSGENTYSGGTDIQEGRIAYTTANSFGSGPITLGENAGLGSTALGSTTVFNNILFQGSVARFGMGTYLNTLTGTVDLSAGTRTFRLINSLILNAAVSNGGIILQSDLNAQRLELNDSNSYEGTTTVNRGRLVVNGEITSNVTVNRGVTDVLAIGSVGGTGLIIGSVAIDGELRPGANTADSPGTLQIAGPLTLSQTSNAIFEVEDEANTDRVTNLTGITLDGNITLTLLGTYVPEIGASFDLFDSASTPVVGPNLQFTLPALPAGRAWDTSAFASTGVISVVEGAASAYDLWATSYGLTGSDADRSFDFEGDGLTNQQEFLFGGDPTKSTPSILQISKAGATLTLTYFELESGGSYTITSNENLVGAWLPAAGLSAVDPVDQTGAPAGYVRKQFTTPAATRDFFRVEGTEAP